MDEMVEMGVTVGTEIEIDVVAMVIEETTEIVKDKDKERDKDNEEEEKKKDLEAEVGIKKEATNNS